MLNKRARDDNEKDHPAAQILPRRAAGAYGRCVLMAIIVNIQPMQAASVLRHPNPTVARMTGMAGLWGIKPHRLRKAQHDRSRNQPQPWQVGEAAIERLIGWQASVEVGGFEASSRSARRWVDADHHLAFVRGSGFEQRLRKAVKRVLQPVGDIGMIRDLAFTQPLAELGCSPHPSRCR